MGDYSWHFLHKATPILLLFFVLLSNTLHTRSSAILFATAALLFSACGDVLLALTIPNNFVFGLGAFLLAHICYCVVFWQWRVQPASVYAFVLRTFTDPKTKWIALAFSTFTLLMAGWIVPKAGELAVPVTVYMCAILLMALTATNTSTYHTEQPYVAQPKMNLILLGAMLFVISDAIIAINMFILPVPYQAYLIMTTYYLAQYLLFKGIMQRIKTDMSPLP